MLRMAPLIVILCAVVATSGCGRKEFKKFTSEKGKFSVMMPGTPKESTQSVKGVKLYLYQITERNGMFAAAYGDLNTGKETDAQTSLRLNGAVRGMVSNINGKLINEKKIKLNGKYPGREAKAELPGNKGTMHARIYFVNGRLYQVFLGGTDSWMNGVDAEEYLNSFKLEK